MDFLQNIAKKSKELADLKGERVLLGFSGGPDSVFLANLLIVAGVNFDICHVNHSIRGESADKDEIFCLDYAKTYNIKCYSCKINVPELADMSNMTLEEAGREARYKCFRDIMSTHGYTRLALAHNRDDQIETFLFRLMRGTSIAGLQGIASHDDIVRPIADIYKKDIVRYLDDNNIPYCIDHTNNENDQTRNSIRNELLPFIEKRYNPVVKDKVYNLIEELRLINTHFDEICNKYCNLAKLEISDLLTFDTYTRMRIINDYLVTHHVAVTRAKLGEIDDILHATGHKTLDIGDSRIITKDYTHIYIQNKNKNGDILRLNMLAIPGEITWGDYVINATLVTPSQLAEAGDIHDDKYTFTTNISNLTQVTVRSRTQGDTIVPIGMTGHKKIKDIFINEKIPAPERDHIPIIADGDSIIWVAGVKKSQLYKRNTVESADNKEIKPSVRFTIRRKTSALNE